MTTTTTEVEDLDQEWFDRDQWGRPLIPDPDTGEAVPYMRTSSFASLLNPPYLNDYHLGWGAKAALSDPGEAYRIAVAEAAGESVGGMWADLAHRAGMNFKRDLGTERHRTVRKLLTGQELPPLTAKQRKGLQRVADAILCLGTIESVETPLIADEFRCAGSADYVGTAQDGTTFIADLKTGARYSDSIHSWAVQTVVYSRSRTYRNRERGDWVAPAQPRLYIVHAPQSDPDKVDIIEIDPLAAKELAYRSLAIANARAEFRRINPEMETYAA